MHLVATVALLLYNDLRFKIVAQCLYISTPNTAISAKIMETVTSTAYLYLFYLVYICINCQDVLLSIIPMPLQLYVIGAARFDYMLT